MRAIDTNVLVRLIARDDDKQVAAAESFVARGVRTSYMHGVTSVAGRFAMYR